MLVFRRYDKARGYFKTVTIYWWNSCQYVPAKQCLSFNHLTFTGLKYISVGGHEKYVMRVVNKRCI